MPEFEDRLRRTIVGLPLWGATRAADMQRFMFGRAIDGTRTDGRAHQYGEFELHVQCPWRLISNGLLIVGSRDLSEPRSGLIGGPDFDWEPIGSNLRDELLDVYIEDHQGPRFVRQMGLELLGDLRLTLDDGSELQLFSANSQRPIEGEYWRFTQVDGEHLVATTARFYRIG